MNSYRFEWLEIQKPPGRRVQRRRASCSAVMKNDCKVLDIIEPAGWVQDESENVENDGHGRQMLQCLCQVNANIRRFHHVERFEWFCLAEVTGLLLNSCWLVVEVRRLQRLLSITKYPVRVN